MSDIDRPVILGGGVAGIAAAVHLAERGTAPILVESRPYLGGRARSFRHAETGDEIDNGQHLLMGCYHETLRLLEHLGTRPLLDLQPALRVEFRETNGTAHLLSAPRFLPSPLNVAAGMLRFAPLSLRERLGLLRTGLSAMAHTPPADESVAAYLTRLGQSARARTWLWDPIVLATLNTSPEQGSARLFTQVMRLGFMGLGDNSKLALPRTGLSGLFSPAEAFITARGGTVITGNQIRRVDTVEGKEGRWRVHLRSGENIETSALISALPWRSFRSLLAPHLPELPAIVHPIEHNPIISLYLWFDSPLETIPPFCALIGTTVQWVFNRRTIIPEQNPQFPGLLACVISAPEHSAPHGTATLLRIAETELRAAFAELNNTRLLTSLAITEKHATFAATPQVEALRPPPGEVCSGLFLAGDWTSTELPGTIEGAVRSGLAAARQIRV